MRHFCFVTRINTKEFLISDQTLSSKRCLWSEILFEGRWKNYVLLLELKDNIEAGKDTLRFRREVTLGRACNQGPRHVEEEVNILQWNCARGIKSSSRRGTPSSSQTPSQPLSTRHTSPLSQQTTLTLSFLSPTEDQLLHPFPQKSYPSGKDEEDQLPLCHLEGQQLLRPLLCCSLYLNLSRCKEMKELNEQTLDYLMADIEEFHRRPDHDDLPIVVMRDFNLTPEEMADHCHGVQICQVLHQNRPKTNQIVEKEIDHIFSSFPISKASINPLKLQEPVGPPATPLQVEDKTKPSLGPNPQQRLLREDSSVFDEAQVS